MQSYTKTCSTIRPALICTPPMKLSDRKNIFTGTAQFHPIRRSRGSLFFRLQCSSFSPFFMAATRKAPFQLKRNFLSETRCNLLP
jgi:hypothetical protein